MNRVVDKGDINLVSVAKLAPTKTFYINANQQMNGTDKPAPAGPNAIFIGANGDMQKL